MIEVLNAIVFGVAFVVGQIAYTVWSERRKGRARDAALSGEGE